MTVKEYFMTRYPERKEKYRQWLQRTKDYENVSCSVCGHDCMIGEFDPEEGYRLPEPGSVSIESFSKDATPVLLCDECGHVQEFEKKRLIFVRDVQNRSWMPMLKK